MSEWYQGMTFVYRKGTELDEKLVAIVKILLKKGFKWIEWGIKKEGFTVGWEENGYVVKEYGEKEIDVLELNSGAEWLANVEPKRVKRVWDKEAETLISSYYKEKEALYLYVVPFPPEEYYHKYGIKYEKKNPFHPESLVTCEEGNRVEIYGYKKEKECIIIDFRSLHRYFEYSEPPLSEAVERFAVDLMRDLAKETKPEYAYMDLEEYRPLENDPVCENMRELVRFWRREGIYTVGGSMLWIPKDVMLRDFEMEELRKVRSVTGKEWEVVIEEHGKYLFLYPMRRMVGSYGYYVGYRYKNRNREYEFLKDLKKEWISIDGVCGSVDKGLELKIRIDSEDEKEEIIKKIEKLRRKHRVNVKDVKFVKKE